MQAAHAATEADILAAVISPDKPDLPPEQARAILGCGFGQPAIERMNLLAEQNRQGALTTDGKAELDRYLRVGAFLNLIQAKARHSLAGCAS